MPPALVAVAAAVASAAVQVYVDSQILAAILLVAISVAAAALTRKPNRSYNQGQEVKLKLDPSMPRQVALGVTGTGGSLVWAFTYTDNSKKPNRYLVRIIQLSDLPINNVLEVREGKDILTFAGGDIYSGYVACDQHRTKKGAAAMWMRVYKGAEAAVADASLTTWSGGLWTANHKGVNAAYVILKYDNDPDAFPNGEPQLTFGLEGAKLYDERYDDTAGGSGAQRLADPTTWSFSKNATVITANVLRGLFSAGVLLYGAQAEARDLDTSMLFSAHNTCDQSIDTSIGTVPRYQAGIMATSADPTSTVLLDLQASFDGRIIDRGGAITLRPGAAHTPVFNLVDDDLVWNQQKSWQPRATLSDITNSVTGTYVESQEGFIEKAFPPIRNAAWEAEDGGERFTTNIAFRAVYLREQAQRITKRVGDAGRYQGTIAFALPIWALEIEQGDWFTFTSARWNFATKYFEAATVDIILGDQLMIAITGREVSPSFSSWDYAVDEKPRGDTQWSTPSYDLVNPDFSVSQYHVVDAASYQEVFGLNVQLYNIPDGFAAKQVEIEVAYTADKANPWKAGIVSAQDQIYTVLGLTPSTNYSVRVRSTDGQRYADFSTWIDVATASSTSPLPADIAALETDTANALAAISAAETDIGDLQTQAATIEADIIAAQGDIATLYTATATNTSNIATNATAISNNVGSLAALTVEVRADNSNRLNANYNFSIWSNSSSPPDTWENWIGPNGTTTTRTRIASPNGGYSVQETVTNTTGQIGFRTPAPSTGNMAAMPPGWYVIECEVKLVSGVLTGAALRLSADNSSHIEVQAFNINFSADPDSSGAVVGTGTVGLTYRYSKLVHVTTGTAVEGILYCLTNWNSLTPSNKTLNWNRASVRPATQEEIANQTVLTPLVASVTTNTTAIATNTTSIATLNTTVAAHDASITTNALAISTLDTNYASLSTLVRSGDTRYLNPNANFADYPTTPGNPTNWSAWVTTSTPVRVAGELPGTYAVQDTVTAGNNQGNLQIGQGTGNGLDNVNASEYLVLEADVQLVSGSLQGAGIHISWRDSSPNSLGSKNINFYTEPDSTGSPVGAGTVGSTYRFRELVQAPAGAVDHAILYRMTGWTGFGTVTAKTLKWYKCGVRPATNEEIAAGVALPSLEATVSSQATTLSSHTTSIASLNTTVSAQGVTISNHTTAINTNTGNITTAFARAALTLDVNNYVTGWEINNNGTTSDFKIRADRFTIANGTGTPFEVIGSQIYMKNILVRNAQIDVLSVGTSNIQDNAVTDKASYFNGANFTPSGASFQTIAQVTVAIAAGQTIRIDSSFIRATTTLLNFYGEFRIVRGGTVILTSPLADGQAVGGPVAVGGPTTMPTEDTPAAGTYTYYLQVKRTDSFSTADGGYVYNRSMYARLYKK